MKKKIILAILCVHSLVMLSQQNEMPEKFTQNGFAAFDYLSVQMPLDEFGFPETNMGLVGTHYNLWLSKSFYTGLGFYSSVNGQRGGLFTLGINAGLKQHITDDLFIDTGFHFGGGGGAGAPDGGGAFILPHFNLGYQFKNFSTILGYSYINFFDKGNINGNQLRFGVQIPLSFNYSSFKNKEKSFNTVDLQNSKWNNASKRVSLMLHVDNLSPYGDSQTTTFDSLKGKVISLAGFEFHSYLSTNWFILFKADGAFNGIKAGYMDLFIGGGYHFSMNNDRTNLLAKFAVGAGGGGGADTGGGLLVYPSISLEQYLFNQTYISISKGYLGNPNQHFTTSTLGIGLKHYLNYNGIKDRNDKFNSNNKFKGIEFIINQEIYANAERELRPTQNLYQLVLQLNLFVNQHFYLAGQTSFANFGNAGAYAEGIVGLGYQTKPMMNNSVQFFTQLMAGAAGGGQISTGEGLIFKPSIGFNFGLSDKISLRASAGKVKATNGTLYSTFFNIGLNYRISFLTSR